MTGIEILTGSGIATILIGGIATVMKTRFVTKGQFNRRKDECQRHIVDSLSEVKNSIGSMEKKQDERYKEHMKTMLALTGAIGELKGELKRVNGGNQSAQTSY